MDTSWTDKYWDIINNLYWTPRYLGLKSIPRDKWKVNGDWVMVPKDLISNTTGPLYSRARRFGELKAYLENQEEILNHVFNLTFSIAADTVVAKLLFEPLGFDDPGPIQSLGREIRKRYGWPQEENITQHDGLFVGANAIVGVELKLGSQSWPEQIAKYIALMMWEEHFIGKREDFGLLFIVPKESMRKHWSAIGLEGPDIDDAFFDRLNLAKLPARIRRLFDAEPDQARSALRKLRMKVLSWDAFARQIEALEQGADQTLQRLLMGLRTEIRKQHVLA